MAPMPRWPGSSARPAMRVVEEEEDEEHAPPLDAEAAAAALQSYVAFRGRLQGDLEQCSQLRRGLQDEQRCYADLSSNIEHLQREGLREVDTLVPLGAGVHARAAVPDTSRIFVHVALGFHPELTLEEAKSAAALRQEHLQRQVDARTAELAGIRAHLRLVDQALADLAELQAKSQA